MVRAVRPRRTFGIHRLYVGACVPRVWFSVFVCVPAADTDGRRGQPTHVRWETTQRPSRSETTFHTCAVGAARGRAGSRRRANLGHLLQAHAVGSDRDARGVLVGPEHHDAILGCAVRLHALEHSLPVVEHRRRGGDADVTVRHYPSLPLCSTRGTSSVVHRDGKSSLSLCR